MRFQRVEWHVSEAADAKGLQRILNERACHIPHPDTDGCEEAWAEKDGEDLPENAWRLADVFTTHAGTYVALFNRPLEGKAP